MDLLLPAISIMIVYIYTKTRDKRQTQRIRQLINLSYVNIESMPNTSFKIIVRMSVYRIS